ncbi:MAG TPA: four helix bundle protein [Chryseosolibacter sp.]
MKNFKKLKVWQKGMSIVVSAYKLARQLPREERFGLALQITKAAVSIPANIAEGSAKSSSLDYKRYLEISLGSAYELETHVLATEMLGYGEAGLRTLLLKDVDEEQKMLQSFIKTVGG